MSTPCTCNLCGETFDAWVYLLRRAPDEKKRLVSGRWVGR